MDTHYAKARKQPGSQMKGPMHSLLYSLLPDDSLVSRKNIIMAYRNAITKEGDHKTWMRLGLASSEADIVGALNVLVEDGFARELNGVRLEKIVEGRLI